MTQDGISYLNKVEESLVSFNDFDGVWKFVAVVVVVELFPFVTGEIFVEYVVLWGAKGNVEDYVGVVDFLT